MDLKEKLAKVPFSPGIYIMKDARERVIYVGKAKSLRNRLRSYFQKSASLDSRKSAMVREIRDFDYVITQSELEALVLEANFIKKFRPGYNIILRDDKNYPYLKLTVNEEWPGLEVVRKITKDGALYFGPYVPSGIMWETLKFIRRTFPLKQCKYNLEKPFRPCIQHQIGRCLAPCDESLRETKHRQRYAEIVNEVRLFLQGENRELLASLEERMQNLSDELRYEDAGEIRDRIKMLKRAWETQRVLSPELGDMDVIGIYREHDGASIFMLFVRNRMVIGQKSFFLKNLKGIDDKELTAGFIEQFYSKEMLIPPKIILPVRGRFETQRLWLSKKKGDMVKLMPAKSKEEKEVFKMASDNAVHSFTGHKETKPSEVLIALKNLLNLKAVPKRIEAVDVSNISGSESVGAVVVWEDGSFAKDDYRLFKIKTIAGIDDFAMIGEVVGRHFAGLCEKGDGLPQLFLIDGGKGQLESAMKTIKPFDLPVEIAAIAKAKDEKADRIFLPGRTTAIPLEPASAVTHLLQRIRDEVHRFAISYHKKLRAKRTLESPLEKIKGIGKKRRLALLKHFGSIDNIRKASHDDIAGIKGFNKKIAEKVLEGVK